MGGNEQAKKNNGAQCTTAGECNSNVCAKPCSIPTAQWGRIKDVDHWNRLKFCGIPGLHPGLFTCIDTSSEYPGQILLNADGKINYRGNAPGSKSTWNKSQCIKGVNCGDYVQQAHGKICAGVFWLKGEKTSSKQGCETNCGGRSGCKTFCWSDSSPEWDCLMYRECPSYDWRFSSGNSASQYTCYTKTSGDEQAMSLDMAGEEARSLAMVDTATTSGVDTLAVDVFALIGLLCVFLAIFRKAARYMTKPSSTVKQTFTAEPTETTSLDIPSPSI